MRVKFFCPRWGQEHIPWPAFLQSVKDAGYAGVEWFPFGEECDHSEVLRLLKKFDLEFCIVTAVLQHYPAFKDYLAELDKQLTYLCSLKVEGLSPSCISAQTGREFYSIEQVEEILGCCKRISEQTNVPIYQETHRNKWPFAAHSTAPLLNRHDDLYLTFDISHWFCVSESYLHDQHDTVAKAIRQARHIHARVGHTEGPQVWDPALPEFAEALEEHLKVWDKYIEQRKNSGASYCTITPEFGPPPYMVFGNRQGLPHEEQWRVNLWMKNLLENRYANVDK
jgi:sugar phosphate isomerase/epimerase